jgi:hypothetical protein
MVAVRKDLEICLGRGAIKIPLLTELKSDCVAHNEFSNQD